MNRYRKAYIRQQDQFDCGVACLASLIKLYGGDVRLETLRELSGTGVQGTTLLGLYQAAPQLGLEAEAFEGDIGHLKEVTTPVILHVLIDGRLQHYVICYGYENGHFIISDPAKGLSLYTSEQLENIWKSKALLTVQPGINFKKAEAVRNEKWYWLKALIKDDLNTLSIALFLGIVIAILGLSTAVFSQKLVDDILPEKHYLKLTVGLSLLFFLLLIRTGLSYIRQHFLNNQSRNFNNRIINHFYGSLLHLPKSFFDSRKTGELVARMNDTLRIQNALSYITANLMIDVLVLIITALFILSYSATLGLIALSCIPLYFISVYFFHDRIVNNQRQVMNAYSRNESNYVDTIQGIGTIKAANRESFFAGVTKHIYSHFQNTTYNLGVTRIKFNLLTEVIGTLIIACILSLGAWKVVAEGLKTGEFMAIIQMVGLLMPAAGRLALTNIQLQEARVAFDRMFEFTSIKPEYGKEDDSRQAVTCFRKLEVKNLSFRFPGRKQLLKNISFRIEQGEMIALLGESGCGKSTTLQIIQKFYKHENGEIKVNDNDWNDISVVSWRKLIGVVPQQVKIFNGTVLDNICVGDTSQEAENIISFCRTNGFDPYFSQLPQGYATIIGEEGINLSGGQQQLIALARALYQKPQLLILDEATSAMDRNTEAFILELLHKMKRELSVIMVTHRVKTAKKADRIYVIEEGVTKSFGAHEELLMTENLYSQAWADMAG